MQKSVTDAGKDRRVAFFYSFRQYLEDNPLDNSAHLVHRRSHVSEQNMLVWGTENRHTVMETPLHPRKCKVWSAISPAGIEGPIRLDDTVNDERCLNSFKTTLFQLFKQWE
jgi:hypothetical protein